MSGQMSAAEVTRRFDDLKDFIALQTDGIGDRLGGIDRRLSEINGTVRKHDREIGVLDERTKGAGADAKKHGGIWGSLGGFIGGIVSGMVSGHLKP